MLSSIALFFSGQHIFFYAVHCTAQLGCDEPAPTSVTIAFFGMASPILICLVGAAIGDRRLFRAGAGWQTRLVAYIGFLLTPFLLYAIVWEALLLLIS
jgi:F0F1-type ATP synthase membrane subunit c/vacuolar-type H+-ATPase subunit K